MPKNNHDTTCTLTNQGEEGDKAGQNEDKFGFGCDRKFRDMKDNKWKEESKVLVIMWWGVYRLWWGRRSLKFSLKMGRQNI